jgi:hypothetical protein
LQDGKNAITYSNGENSLIILSFLQENADGSVKFKVEMPQTDLSKFEGKGKVEIEEGFRRYLYFDKVEEKTTAYVISSSKKIKKINPRKIVDGKYGKPIETPTQFVKTELPKNLGFEQYVYVCYKDSNGLSSVKEYHIAGIKDVKLSTVITVSVTVGVVIPTLLGAIIKIKKKLRGKKDE